MLSRPSCGVQSCAMIQSSCAREEERTVLFSVVYLFWKGCTDPTFLFTTRVDICAVVLRRPSCCVPSCALIQSSYASGLLHRSSREKGRWKGENLIHRRQLCEDMRLQVGYLSCVSIQWNICIDLVALQKILFSACDFVCNCDGSPGGFREHFSEVEKKMSFAPSGDSSGVSRRGC